MHDHDDDHNDKQIIEFLEKFFKAYLDLKNEVINLNSKIERLENNEQKILDFLKEKFPEQEDV